MRISDWSSDVCSSDLHLPRLAPDLGGRSRRRARRQSAREIHQHRGNAASHRAVKEPVRTALRALLALAYGYAGWRHLVTPAPFLAITPPWVPRPELVVAATGIARSEEHTSELQSLMR